MKKLIYILGSLCLVGTLHATTVQLINDSPQPEASIVYYQLLGEQSGQVYKTAVPANIDLPEGAVGIQAVSIVSDQLPMPGHQFYFPEPGCVWKASLGTPPQLTFKISEHELSCS